MTRGWKRKLLVVVSLILLGVSIVFVKILRDEKPQRYVERGKVLMKQGNSREAARNFVHAISLDPTDAETMVLYGDAVHAFPRFDLRFTGKDRAAWERALELQPKHFPAKLRLMASWRAEAVLAPEPEVFQALLAAAKRVIDHDPAHREAQAVWRGARLALWLLEEPRTKKEVEEDIAVMEKLLEIIPVDAHLYYYTCRAHIQLYNEMVALDTLAANPHRERALALSMDLLRRAPEDLFSLRCRDEVMRLTGEPSPAAPVSATQP